jgi:uncharacterized integral membrane protein
MIPGPRRGDVSAPAAAASTWSDQTVIAMREASGTGQKEREMHVRRHRSDFGALVIGAVILFAGIYYMLRNTFGFELGELDWEPIWPILVIVLGGSIIFRALYRQRGE